MLVIKFDYARLGFKIESYTLLITLVFLFYMRVEIWTLKYHVYNAFINHWYSVIYLSLS